MDELLKTAYQRVKAEKPCLLAVVLDSKGSAPRGSGSMMLLFPDGSIRGSVGGGPLEWTVMQEGAVILKESLPAHRLTFEMTGTDVEAAEAVCGGIVHLLLYPLRAEDRPPLELICDRIDRRKSACFGILQEKGTPKLFAAADGKGIVSGYADISPGVLRMLAEEQNPTESAGVLYFSSIAPRPRLWLMGGGHVALATAMVAQVTGFGIVVVDDREDFANEARFPGARCIVCRRYDEIPAEEVSPSDYIAILTRGHRHDREALAWALKTEAGYVGMIGSRKKISLIYQSLREEGVPQEKLDQVHSPIGLPIGDHTPGDIAVSIMAEIVAIRAERAGEHTPHTKSAII